MWGDFFFVEALTKVVCSPPHEVSIAAG
jgi:hypothetical protein